MSLRLPLALCLLAAVSALAPMAFASPPDPIWVGGLFDAGDSDDVIVAATSAVGATDGAGPRGVETALVVLGVVPSAVTITVDSTGLSLFQGRAPPSA